MKSAVVITPTTGSPDVVDAINSVKLQTYNNVDHLIVVDGSQFSLRTDQTFRDAGIISARDKLYRTDLPFNTGGNGYYGHRVMAAFSHLVNYDYVLFLDQDNWYDPNHVELLIEECEKYNFEWSYSLRKIYDNNKNYICDDNCESLGRWPTWVNDKGFLVDSSSYCFTQKFIRVVGHVWDHGWGADRRFYTILKDEVGHNNYGCTGRHTLNYRLGGNEGSVNTEFFIEGNKKTTEQYQGSFPWSTIIK